MFVQTGDQKENLTSAGKLNAAKNVRNTLSKYEWICQKENKIKNLIPLVIPGGKEGNDRQLGKEYIAMVPYRNEKKAVKDRVFEESDKEENRKQIDLSG